MTGSDSVLLESDQKDIAASLGGDPDAYERLVRRYQNDVARWMYRFTRDIVILEELVQDVFIEAWMSLPKFKGKSGIKTWLFTIATRVGYRYWRKKEKDKRMIAEASERLTYGKQELDVTASEAGERLHHLLACLPPRDRLVLTLIYFEELDTKEVAEVTGWTKSLVKVQAYRARNKLRKLLEESEAGRHNND